VGLPTLPQYRCPRRWLVWVSGDGDVYDERAVVEYSASRPVERRAFDLQLVRLAVPRRSHRVHHSAPAQLGADVERTGSRRPGRVCTLDHVERRLSHDLVTASLPCQ